LQEEWETINALVVVLEFFICLGEIIIYWKISRTVSSQIMSNFKTIRHGFFPECVKLVDSNGFTLEMSILRDIIDPFKGIFQD